MHDLECHRPVVLEISSEIDSGHATAAELSLDAVTLGNTGLELLAEIVHQIA
jgi:hypothetical protein